MDAGYSDDDCFICFDVMWDPTKTPCNHTLCLTCLENILRFKRLCPLCRAEIPTSFKPTIDKVRQKEIHSKHKSEYNSHMRKLRLQKIFCDTLTISYGNTHKIVNSTSSNTHAWSAFVRLEDNKLDISKFIKKVVFIVHPTFKDPVIEVTEAPFRITRVGWGTFPVGIVIHWQPWLEHEPTKLAHDLSFEGDGDAKLGAIKFKKSIFPDSGDDVEGEMEVEEEVKEEPPRRPQRPELKTLTVDYGNRHELMNSQGQTNGHRWTAFVKLDDNGLDISKYIEKVVYKLHPTFQNPERTVTATPFELRCIGWGTFDIGIVIYWKPWLEKAPTQLTHELSFEGDGASKVQTIQFDKSLL